MVMEAGEADLATVLTRTRNEKGYVEGNFARLAWQQMLEAVQTIHDERIVHGDLKPANFLFVRVPASDEAVGGFIFDFEAFRAASGPWGRVDGVERCSGPTGTLSPRPVGERSTLMPSYRAGPGPPEAY
jgi:hypothetical protein